MPVAELAALPDGAIKPFTAGAVQGFLINRGGQIHALSRVCRSRHGFCSLALPHDARLEARRREVLPAPGNMVQTARDLRQTEVRSGTMQQNGPGYSWTDASVPASHCRAL